MDFPVEATIHLNAFANHKEVRKILTLHGFEMWGLSGNRVYVEGSFSKLGVVRARLKQLLDSQTRMTSLSSSPVSMVSPGATSSYYTSQISGTDGNRNQQGHVDKPPLASPASPAPRYRASTPPPRPEQRTSTRSRSETFVVDADLFNYTKRFRERDIAVILHSHNVKLTEHNIGNSYNIIMQGKNAKVAANKLQSLLNDLQKQLCTQEVPLEDMGQDAEVVLKRIQKNKGVYSLVLVCEMRDRLHLIGPSGESYELKQRLLGRPVMPSGRTGRTLDKGVRQRSQTLPPLNRRSKGNDWDGITKTLPAGARGYSATKH